MKSRLVFFAIVLFVGLVTTLAASITAAQTVQTPTATPPRNTLLVEDAFVRSGPADTYVPVGALTQASPLNPVNRNEAGDWVLIRYNRGFGWLRRDLAFWAVNIDALPILTADNLTPSPVPGRETATAFFPTSTPTGDYIRVNATSAYVRAGPGRTYLRLGQLFGGQAVAPVGRNEDVSWILIEFSEGFGWIRSDLAIWVSDLEALPVLMLDNLTPSATFTSSATPTQTPSLTNTATASHTPTATPTFTPSPTRTPSLTNTATASHTPAATPTFTPSPTRTPSLTNTPTATSTLLPSPTPTVTPSLIATSTDTPTAPPTALPTATSSPTVTISPTATPSLTSTLTATDMPTVTSSPTVTITPSLTSTATASRTLPASDVPTVTSSATFTLTVTLTASLTNVPLTSTPQPTQESAVIVPTVTPTRLLPTNTATTLPSPTSTVTRTSSPTHTPSATFTAEPSATSTLTNTRIPTEEDAVIVPSATSVSPTNTSSAVLSPTDATEITASSTDTVTPDTGIVIVPTVQSTLTPQTDTDGGVSPIPVEAVVGGIGLLGILGYIALYLRGAAGAERYAKGFVIDQCPVCRRGELVVETSPKRTFGIPNVRHIVRCTNCRSVLREISYRRWRYAVDRLENIPLFDRLNNREVDEETLVMLLENPTAPSGGAVVNPRFVDKE